MQQLKRETAALENRNKQKTILKKIHPPYLNLSYSSYMYKFTNPSGTAMVQVPLPTNPRTAEPWRLLAVLRVLQSVPRS